MTGSAKPPTVQRCRSCGCTADNCEACFAKTGEPCFWVERDLCSACAPPDLVSKMKVIGVAGHAVEVLSQLAQLFESYAVPPPGELGVVISQAIELFERLDLSEAPAEELTRWAALSAITAGHAAQMLHACMIAIARPDVGRRGLAAVAPNPIPVGARPLIVTPDGRSAAAAGGLVDVAGRPLTAGAGRG